MSAAKAQFSDKQQQSKTSAAAQSETKLTKRIPQQNSAAKQKGGPKRRKTSKEEDWSGESWVTRCICEYTHTDDFMIQCEECQVWQHGDCMAVKRRSVPETYFCELCRLRPVNKLKAHRLQKQKRLELELTDSDESDIETTKKKPSITSQATINEYGSLFYKEFGSYLAEPYEEITKNDYSQELLKKLRPSNEPISLKETTKGFAQKLCEVMDVAPGRQGLVTTRTVPKDQAIIEYRGKFALQSDYGGCDRLKRMHPYALRYQLAQEDDGESFGICVDARSFGNIARFVRRCCSPNCEIRHVVDGSLLRLMIYATELVEKGTEITIPFDYDISNCKYRVECACSDPACLVKAHNLLLNQAGKLARAGLASPKPESKSHGAVKKPAKRPSIAKKTPPARAIAAKRPSIQTNVKSTSKAKKGVAVNKKWRVKLASGGAAVSRVGASAKLSTTKSSAATRAAAVKKKALAVVHAAEATRKAKGRANKRKPEEEVNIQPAKGKAVPSSAAPTSRVKKGADGESAKIVDAVAKKTEFAASSSKQKPAPVEVKLEEANMQKLSREERKMQDLLARIDRVSAEAGKLRGKKPTLFSESERSKEKEKERKQISAEAEFLRSIAATAEQRSGEETTTQTASGNTPADKAVSDDKSLLKTEIPGDVLPATAFDSASPTATSNEAAKGRRRNELRGLEDYWVKREQAGVKQESWTLPADRIKGDREQRKMQLLAEQLARMDERKDKSVHKDSPATFPAHKEITGDSQEEAKVEGKKTRSRLSLSASSSSSLTKTKPDQKEKKESPAKRGPGRPPKTKQTSPPEKQVAVGAKTKYSTRNESKNEHPQSSSDEDDEVSDDSSKKSNSAVNLSRNSVEVRSPGRGASVRTEKPIEEQRFSSPVKGNNALESAGDKSRPISVGQSVDNIGTSGTPIALQKTGEGVPARKRWLRQAMSETTDQFYGDLTTAVTPPPDPSANKTVGLMLDDDQTAAVLKQNELVGRESAVSSDVVSSAANITVSSGRPVAVSSSTYSRELPIGRTNVDEESNASASALLSFAAATTATLTDLPASYSAFSSSSRLMQSTSHEGFVGSSTGPSLMHATPYRQPSEQRFFVSALEAEPPLVQQQEEAHPPEPVPEPPQQPEVEPVKKKVSLKEYRQRKKEVVAVEGGNTSSSASPIAQTFDLSSGEQSTHQSQARTERNAFVTLSARATASSASPATQRSSSAKSSAASLVKPAQSQPRQQAQSLGHGLYASTHLPSSSSVGVRSALPSSGSTDRASGAASNQADSAAVGKSRPLSAAGQDFPSLRDRILFGQTFNKVLSGESNVMEQQHSHSMSAATTNAALSVPSDSGRRSTAGTNSSQQQNRSFAPSEVVVSTSAAPRLSLSERLRLEFGVDSLDPDPPQICEVGPEPSSAASSSSFVCDPLLPERSHEPQESAYFSQTAYGQYSAGANQQQQQRSGTSSRIYSDGAQNQSRAAFSFQAQASSAPVYQPFHSAFPVGVPPPSYSQQLSFLPTTEHPPFQGMAGDAGIANLSSWDHVLNISYGTSASSQQDHRTNLFDLIPPPPPPPK